MFNSRAGYADAIAGAHHNTPALTEDPPSPVQRNGSVTTITTRPMTFAHGPGVTIERNATPSDDDIIMVTVKLSNKLRRASYDEDLPERPAKRGFLRRMSTRILPPPEDEKWKAVKMPRGEYKKNFMRDRNGSYVGSEPQRDWDEEDIKREYGMYQDLPVGTSLS